MLLADTESALIAAETARRTAYFVLAGTGLTALVSIIVAIIAQLSARKTQHVLKRLEHSNNKKLKRLEHSNNEKLKELELGNNEKLKQIELSNNERLKRIDLSNNEKLATLNAALGKRKSEEDARRDYDYEARKRLYQECEPLIFQFVELSDNALHRIYSLARSTRHGYLPGWLCNNDYYIASTMYNLLAPMVIYKLIQRRLTTVDLALDRNIDRHYQLAKHIAWSFTADFDFAWGLKVFPLSYDPNNPYWLSLRESDPSVYWRQGLPVGRFDSAVESLIVRDPNPDGYQRVMSFGEFESELHKSSSQVSATFSVVQDMITCFHPETRPVLWRMLIAQAHVYDAIVKFHKEDAGGKEKELVVTPIPENDRKVFYWLRNPDDAQLRQLNEPFSVAETYWQNSLGNLFKNKDD